MSSRAKSDARKRAIRAYYASKNAAPRKTQVTGYGAYKAEKAPVYYKKYKSSSSKSAYDPPDSIGAKIGGWLGHGCQSLLKAITGFGDYRVEKNSIMEGGMSPPQVVNSVDNGGTILRHREYIGDVLATTAFTVQKYEINPALQGTFPWLSAIAENYELYRMRGLIFEFKSLSSDAVLSTATNSALGYVVMATQYNSLQPQFTSKMQMENHEFANSSKPSCDFIHPVECKRSLLPNDELYTRDGDVPDGGDIRLFDLGQFCIATGGQQAVGGVLGELWVSYEIELYQQKYSQPFSIRSAHIQSGGCVSAGNLQFGTSFAFAPNNSIDITIQSNFLAFPASVKDGRFIVLIRYLGSASAFVAPTMTPTGMTVLGYWQGGGSVGNSASETIATAYLSYVFNVTAPAPTMTLTGGTLATSVSDIWITEFDQDIGDIPDPTKVEEEKAEQEKAVDLDKEKEKELEYSMLLRRMMELKPLK